MSPFRSKRQMRFMFWKHPRIARRMANDQKRSQGKGSFKRLPERRRKRKS